MRAWGMLPPLHAGLDTACGSLWQPGWHVVQVSAAEPCKCRWSCSKADTGAYTRRSRTGLPNMPTQGVTG